MSAHGTDYGMEHWIRFGDWCRSSRLPVTVEMIRGHFNVSRATAYRWFNAWRMASGQ